MKSIAATLGVAILLAGSPLLASADTQASPIHLDNVEVLRAQSGDSYIPGSANISFTNDANAPATNIVFVLESKGDILARYEDVGSFAKGTTINHSFPDAESENDQQIAVQRATFTNGTVWNNPNLPEMPAAFSGSSIGAVGSDE
jgi:hypothetical protein